MLEIDDSLGVLGRACCERRAPRLVDGRAFQLAELGNVAADVLALWVQSLRLCDGVEDAVRARVNACSRYPLPVAGVVRDVAVDEQLEEKLRSSPPIDPERLRQERRDEQAPAVVHPPLGAKLPHRCIDNRVTGSSVSPGRQRVFVVDPIAVAAVRVVDCRVWIRVQQLQVEIAPAELPNEGLGDRALGARPRHDLGRGDAAEVQVRAQPRRSFPREFVARGLVLVHATAQPRVEAPSRLRLAAAQPGWCGREVAGVDAPRKRHTPRGVERGGQRLVAPTPPIGREDAVVVSVGRNELTRRHRGDRVLDSKLDPLAAAGKREPLLSALRVRAGICADEDDARRGSMCNAQRFFDRVPAADHEVSAALAQREPQVGE